LEEQLAWKILYNICKEQEEVQLLSLMDRILEGVKEVQK